MLIWTTKGPKRAEKPAAEEAFAESSAVDKSADGDKSAKDAPSRDVFLDTSTKPEETAAADDGDWSNAEKPEAKSPEIAE